MLYPPMNTLLEKTNSRYMLVNVVAHRAREIAVEIEESGETVDEKPVSLAIEEIAAGSLSVRIGANH